MLLQNTKVFQKREDIAQLLHFWLNAAVYGKCIYPLIFPSKAYSFKNAYVLILDYLNLALHFYFQPTDLRFSSCMAGINPLRNVMDSNSSTSLIFGYIVSMPISNTRETRPSQPNRLSPYQSLGDICEHHHIGSIRSMEP